MSTFEEADEYCPNCDNHFVLDAKTPQAALKVESEDVRAGDAAKMLRDDRVERHDDGDIWEDKGGETRLG